MIYVCIASHDNAKTIGLLLWKVRKVFDDFPREYHFLVADDGSRDETTAVLEPYEDALPLSVIRFETRKGYRTAVERLIAEALDRSDRPRRDYAVLLPADFSVSPEAIPDLIKRIESGVDVVVAERPDEHLPLGLRLVNRAAPRLLKPGLQLSGYRDVLSGACAFRLITLRNCLRERAGSLLESEGPLANAELLARASTTARQIAVTPIAVRPPHRPSTGTDRPLALALQLFRAGRRLQIPAPSATIQRAG